MPMRVSFLSPRSMMLYLDGCKWHRAGCSHASAAVSNDEYMSKLRHSILAKATHDSCMYVRMSAAVENKPYREEGSNRTMHIALQISEFVNRSVKQRRNTANRLRLTAGAT